MALDTHRIVDPALTADLDRDDRAEVGQDRSNFVAFLLGGVVVAGGLLAFLYYDGDGMDGRNDLATGSIGRLEAPSVLPLVQPQPANPER